MDRLNQLQQFYEEDPDDPFNLYGLALEWSKTNPQKSIDLFMHLLTQHPDYVPTYYQLSLLLIGSNRQADATAVINQGIDVAQKQSDSKAVNELRGLLED